MHTLLASSVIRIGGLGPLSPPGIVWAGRELRDGMALAVQRLNDSGGIGGRSLVLLFVRFTRLPPTQVR